MIISSTHTGQVSSAEVGGKGYNLLRLKQAGFHVPEFVMLPVSFFKGIYEEVETEIIAGMPAILTHFSNDALLAVRSSATVEDGAGFSFAGQFKTLLNIAPGNLKDAVKEVLRSVNQPGVKAYLQYAGITHVGMAVIIQQMVPATVSGVAFGVDPLGGKDSGRVINVAEGLGEDLVSGNITGQSYRTTSEGALQHPPASNGLLDAGKLAEINSVITGVESLFNCKQDIEFAYVQDQFYLLQSRPVTTVAAEAKKIIWDNSNIIESYPGLTLPLTFSFIEKMYSAVYQQLSMVLGIPKAKVEKHRPVYDNMLGLLNGRVYYNLNSWFKALSLLPGYKLNASFMEKMMGVKEKPDIDVNGGQVIKKRVADYTDIAKAVAYIIKNAATVRSQKKDFIEQFDAIYTRFSNKGYTAADLQSIWADYLAFERLMSAEWKAPLVNDFFAMIYFGLLQKMCAKYVPEQPDIHNELVASSKDIITTEPIRLIPQILKVIAEDHTLHAAFRSRPAEEVWELLQEPQHAKALHVINSYLHSWGERCFAELKLETVTYTQRPELFLAILIKYIREDIVYTPVVNNRNADSAQQAIEQKIRGIVKKRMFRHVLSQSRYLISNRENLRIYRTRGFGMVRRMMLAMGVALRREGKIAEERDVFYLKLDELENAVNGSVPQTSLKELVATRKKDYTLFDQIPLPERVVTFGRQEIILPPAETDQDTEQKNVLQGIACSAGVVRAKICKMNTAMDGFRSQHILATYATDPGYVVAFPAVSGILTERGSLLSHAAIVSREMGIPCIVGIEGLMQQLHDGDEVLMDGSTGIVKILNRGEAND